MFTFFTRNIALTSAGLDFVLFYAFFLKQRKLTLCSNRYSVQDYRWISCTEDPNQHPLGFLRPQMFCTFFNSRRAMASHQSYSWIVNRLLCYRQWRITDGWYDFCTIKPRHFFKIQLQLLGRNMWPFFVKLCLEQAPLLFSVLNHMILII